MDTARLKAKFAKMGAKVDVDARRQIQVPREIPIWKYLSKEQQRRLRNVPERLSVDIDEGRKNERFVIVVNQDAEPELDLSVLDLQPADRHLLLMVKDAANSTAAQKFLCGHDERHWFVAAVPEASGASTVGQAKEALKPDAAREAQDRRGVKRKNRDRRRNAGFIRQGEWFFIPVPELEVTDWLVLSDEPLRRGGGKPHIAEFAFRRGGVTVHVSREFPNGLTDEQYADALRRRPELKSAAWRVMKRDAEVFVKGRMRHPDHKTIVLPVWHLVLPNTENRAAASRNVAFLD